MKLVLIAIATIFSLNATATDLVDVDSTALNALLALDPVATSEFGDKRISEILAEDMVSSFAADGSGYLSVVTHSCEQKSGSNDYECTLNIMNSDRVIDGSDYKAAEGMTESSTTITYSVTWGSGSSVLIDTGAPIEYLRAG